MKNPTTATLLNAVPGLGYLYLGRRKLFAILLLATLVLSTVSAFDPMFAEVYTSEELRIWDVIGFLTFILIEVAFMHDAYREAIQANQKK